MAEFMLVFGLIFSALVLVVPACTFVAFVYESSYQWLSSKVGDRWADIIFGFTIAALIALVLTPAFL